MWRGGSLGLSLERISSAGRRDFGRNASLKRLDSLGATGTCAGDISVLRWSLGTVRGVLESREQQFYVTKKMDEKYIFITEKIYFVKIFSKHIFKNIFEKNPDFFQRNSKNPD